MGDIPTVHNHHQDQHQEEDGPASSATVHQTQAEPTNPPPTDPDDLMMDPVQQTNPDHDNDLVHPLGWNFKPTHESNVKTLKRKIAGLHVNLDQTMDLQDDFYSHPPAQLFGGKPYTFKNKYLALAARKFKNNSKHRYNRQLPGSGSESGSWDARGKLTAVLDSASRRVIGTRSGYRFCTGNMKTGKTPSSWKMVEYLPTTTDDGAAAAAASSNLSLCCVYQCESKDEKKAKNKEKQLAKSVLRAEVKAATAKLRAEKTATVAEEARTDYLNDKMRVVLRRFIASQGGSAPDDAAPSASDASAPAAAAPASASGLAGVVDLSDASDEVLASGGLPRQTFELRDEDDEDGERGLGWRGGVGEVRYGEFGSVSIQLRD